MERGTVANIFPEKEFGFIEPDLSGRNIFFHFSRIEDSLDLRVGDRVEYEVKTAPKGPACRIVRLLEEEPESVGG